MSDVNHEEGLLDAIEAIEAEGETDVSIDTSTPEGTEAETKAGYSAEDESQPAAESEATGEGDAEAVAENPAKDPNRPDGFVPQEALREAREAQRAAEARLARVEERTNIILEQMPRPRAEEPVVEQVPSIDEDPVAVIQYQQRQIADLAQQVAGQGQFQEGQQAQEREATERNNIVSGYIADVQQFVGEQPDFMDAYNHLVASKKQELALQGVDPGEAVAHLQAEEIRLVENARAIGRRPAEVVYQIAKERGYSPKPPVDQDAVDAANAKVDQVAQSQAANRSLSGGGSEVKPMSAEDLDNMSEDEFWSYMARNGGDVPSEFMQ